MSKNRLGVIFGGRSGEHEVSLLSAQSVIRFLDQEKYDIVPIAITKEGRWFSGPDALEKMQSGIQDGLDRAFILPEPGESRLYQNQDGAAMRILEELDIVFPVLHGTFGEDGTIQGLFEMAELPYVGAGVLASSVAMDKGLFKSVMRDYEIPVVKDAVFLSADIRSFHERVLDEAQALTDFPLFVKPANMGSSVAVSKCRTREELSDALLLAARYDRRVVVEEGVEAREIEVSVLGNDDPEASVPGEVVPGDEFYSYNAKYIDGTSVLHIPAPIDDALAEEVRRLAIQSFKAIDCAGMARVDFLLDKVSGKLYLNELNSLPGFTQISMYPKLWEASGVTYADLLDRLIDLAWERYCDKKILVRTYEAAA